MIHRELYIGRWRVDFLFAEDKYDAGEVFAYLDDYDAPKKALQRIEEIVSTNYDNTGFTYADEKLYKALIVIGPTSSGEEFINTAVHELYHLSIIIADNIGLDIRGEAPAYIIGDSARALAETFCEFGCRE